MFALFLKLYLNSITCQTNQLLNEVLIKLFVIVCHIQNILSYIRFTKTFLHIMHYIIKYSYMYEVDLRITQTAQRQYLKLQHLTREDTI